MTDRHASAAGPLARGRVTVSVLTRAAWRFTRVVLFVLAAVLSAAASGGEAAAHAFLMDTEPADSSRLESAPSEIRLTFNEPVTPILVQMLDAAGRPVAREKPVAGPDGIVRLALPNPVPTGLYTVSYRVASADGHPPRRDPGGDLAIVVQVERGVLSLFDLRTLTRTVRLVLPAPLGRPFPSADNQFVLIPVDDGRALSVLSTWTYRESGCLPLTTPVSGFGLGVLQSVFVGLSAASQSIQTVDLRNRCNPGVLDLPGMPKAGAPSASGTKFYVALDDGGWIAVVDPLRPSVIRIVETDIGGSVAVVPALDSGFCH